MFQTTNQAIVYCCYRSHYLFFKPAQDFTLAKTVSGVSGPFKVWLDPLDMM